MAAATGHAQPPAARVRRHSPNLLLITFDTTRADRLPAYGYPFAKTPAIDRLAREGILFANTYTPAGAIVATAPLMEVFGLSQGFSTYDDDFEESALTRGVKTIFRFFTNNRVNIRSTRSAKRVVALARQWLWKAAASGDPFFLWVHFIEPHSPYDKRPGFGGRGAAGTVDDAYVSEIEFADHQLGVLLRHLDSLGLSHRTLTVFTADHGESLGEGGYTGHRGEVYECIIRVPLIMRLPGRERAGTRIDVAAQLVDVTPTILEILKLQLPGARFQGASLLDVPRNEPRRVFAIASKIFTRSLIRVAMVYRGRKYVEFPETGETALYDLAADPGETRNLLGTVGSPTARGIDWAGEVRKWWTENDRLRASDFVLTREHLDRLRSLGYIKP